MLAKENVPLAPRLPFDSAPDWMRQAMANAKWPHSQRITIKMPSKP